MSFKVVQVLDVPGALMPDYGEMLRQDNLEVEFVRRHCATEDEIIAAAYDADAVIGVATFQPFSRKVIQRLTKCRLIQSIGIGYDYLDVEAATEQGILAANIPDCSLEEVSDHSMALILACTRRIVQLNDAVKKGGWKAQTDSDFQRSIWPKMSRLRGQILGLIGFGRIPRSLVPKAKGFGLRIIAYDPYVAASVSEDLGVELVTLDKLLAESDIISVHSALTSENRHMLGLMQFKKMKPTACLINTARGPLVDQRALYTALTEGYLAGAALDVTEPEPIDPADPLLKLDNVIVTAHSAHFSIPAYMAQMLRPADEIARVFKGEWPIGLLNPQAKEKYNQKWGQAR